ncbi:polyamine deacetylase HDAC10 isoform X1 [Pleurodeles waltl]|uniref:polyamine deacetylase HDAC10 isoform X1 n=1 Tax=Pleurodeles waltl TaxID=8319 RepID=UPI0037093FB7
MTDSYTVSVRCRLSTFMASGTALIYDEEMTSHKLLWDDPECAIEVPERLSVSYDQLKHYSLVERCVEVPVREATEEEITLVHSPEYLEFIKSTQTMNIEELRNASKKYNAVFFNTKSYRCAKLAAGGVLQLVDSVMSGEVRNGMALVRPPGHHSQRNESNGFCLFNNVAIAAEYAKKKYNLQRVLIVDWDIHHGQGIQYIFEEDPSVLYFSWHRYQHQEFWPNLRESEYDAIGKGKGTGFNINVPWNKVGMGNADYIAVFLHVLLPIAFEFNPELVLVSSGYDSAIGDPEGCMCATPECFSHLTHFLMQLANGKCCIVLEGGYHLRSLSESICMTVKTLLGDPLPQLHGDMTPCLSAVESIHNVRAAHKPYWKCLACSDAAVVQNASTKREVNGTVLTSAKTNKEVEIETNRFLDSHMKSIHVPVPPANTAAAVSESNTRLLPNGVLVCNDTVELGETEAILSDFHVQLVKGANILSSLGHLLNLLNKVLQKQVHNGIVESPDISTSSVVVLKHSINFGLNRLLDIVLGDADRNYLHEEGKILSIRISEKEMPDLPASIISLNFNEDLQRDNSFLYALLRLILPLAYSYQPELTIITLGPNSKLSVGSIAMMIRLLQSLANGRIITVIQDTEYKYMESIAEALMNLNRPGIVPYAPISKEMILAVEERRHKLQEEWKLLQCSVG